MNTKTVEQVLAQVTKLQRAHADALEHCAWSTQRDFVAAVAKVNISRQQLQAAKDLLKLLSEHPELDPLHGMVHPGAL